MLAIGDIFARTLEKSCEILKLLQPRFAVWEFLVVGLGGGAGGRREPRAPCWLDMLDRNVLSGAFGFLLAAVPFYAYLRTAWKHRSNADADDRVLLNRVVLSPRVTAAAPTRWAVLTTTRDRHRVFTATVCAFHWARFLGYRPYLVLVGRQPFDGKTLSLLHEILATLGGRLHLLNDMPTKLTDNAANPGLQSMAVRMYASLLPGIEPDDEFVTTGGDRLPLQTKPFHSAPRPGRTMLRLAHWRRCATALVGGNVTLQCKNGEAETEGLCGRYPGAKGDASGNPRWCRGGYHFDICYWRGTARAWREAAFAGREHSLATFADDFRAFQAWARTGRERWFGDQLMLTEMMVRYNATRPGAVDTMHVDELAPTRGWWNGKDAFDPKTRSIQAGALAMIRRRAAFEMHKMRFDASEMPWSETNKRCVLQVERAALDSHGFVETSLAPLEHFFAGWSNMSHKPRRGTGLAPVDPRGRERERRKEGTEVYCSESDRGGALPSCVYAAASPGRAG